ncbi:unnamed protein product, partial [Brenthis ino]
MNSVNEKCHEKLSTPKRRRLGLRNRLRLTQTLAKEDNNSFINSSPVHLRVATTSRALVPDKCESPPLPCNQVEYLCDSGNDGSITDIPCSPGVFDSCFFKDVENWESFIAGNNDSFKDNKLEEAVDEINNEMFISKLEPSCAQEQISSNILTGRCEKQLRDEVEESFDVLHQSIININRNNETSTLFETKDSFLLDIRESGIIAEQSNSKNEASKSVVNEINHDVNTFYGLPMIVKGLFKSYRNIEKLYDWQEECLNLKAIKERRNLIYALPTSGGKTLVAEVLMLREVLNIKQNALFILPYVAIVQEKIWSLSPFALQLEFLLEEYTGGKGHIPPKKRRKKNSIYVATIEKGLALIRSLIELNRLNEIGLIVVDELHLIGEAGRGSTLEMLLTTVIFANQGIQIVGMSATIGNLPDLAKFLNADVFEKQFRPVELTEYVKLGDTLYKILWNNGLKIVPDRQLNFNYSAAGARLDPDRLGGLVAEVAPRAGVLVFCPTKRNCENVAALLCRLQRTDVSSRYGVGSEMAQHRAAERGALAKALRAEGAGAAQVRGARAGVAFHHAGLGAEERALLEQAFRSGVISVICCTSTLAAGVNLPARRVVVRAPRVARAFLSLAAYRQMAGRAGRAGVCEAGDSIIICDAHEWPQLRAVLGGGLAPVRSALARGATSLVLSAVALKMATSVASLRRLLAATLLAVAPEDPSTNIDQVCDDAIQSLIKSEALEVVGKANPESGDFELAVSTLGLAAIKGCMELSTAKQLVEDMEVASRSLVLLGSLHLLYLVAAPDSGIRPDYRQYYSLYCELDEEGVRTAKVLGITEMNAIRMMTGKPITNVPESVLCRFYLALILRDLCRQVPFPTVAEKYGVGVGTAQAQLAAAAARAAAAAALCDALRRPAFAALLRDLAPRLRSAAAPGLDLLMELPAVKKVHFISIIIYETYVCEQARALQLLRAGYRSVEEVARAAPARLAAALPHLSRSAAEHLVSAAKVMLIEKVENLRAEAEDVMEGLNL